MRSKKAISEELAKGPGLKAVKPASDKLSAKQGSQNHINARTLIKNFV